MAGVAPEVPRALAGRYRLVRLLARGGMAEVWEGRDQVLSRPVAVKILLSHLAADPFLRERFRREAITAARLVHPGIVAIFDAGVEVLGEEGTAPGAAFSGGFSRDEGQRLGATWPEQESTAFIIMELVPGETLRDLIARAGPLPPDLALAITAQVTEALAYAHAQGLVHRDVKPANVLLGAEGDELVRVKVADFGIAKAAANAGLDLTANGALLGTPKYLSPEQVQGDEPDARADLYALGVVLYEMLSGQAPFRASTEMATALAHVQQVPPPLAGLRPGLPPSLYELVDALLVKDPAYRVPSALVLAGALTSVRRTLGLPSASEPGSYVHVPALPPPADGRHDQGSGTALTRADVAGANSGHTAVLAQGAQGKKASGRKAKADKSADGKAGPAVVVGAGPAPELAAVTTVQAVPGQALSGQGAPGQAGPDRAVQGREARRRKTGRAVSVMVAVILLAGAGVVIDLVNQGRPALDRNKTGGTTKPGSTSVPSGGTASSIQIVSVHELTQDGNQPNDHLNLLPNVITGRDGGWQSDLYKGPHFGNSGGFGLALHLSGTHSLAELEVTTSMKGWSAEAFSGSSFAPTLSGWGQPTADRAHLNGSVDLSLSGRKASWVLLWMLDPGPADQAVVQKLAIS